MPLPSIKENYGKAWRAIISPAKIDYSINDMGPNQFNIHLYTIKRTDFRLLNKNGNEIACSFFENSTSSTPLPCVIYLHANGSCRMEALQYKQVILSQNVHLFCFDFSGCGHSGGTYTSVGYHEQDDVQRVIEYLKETNRVTKIALWGRSMGAVTSIMYCSKNPDIACIILDTPFAAFKRLVYELVKNRSKVPQFLVGIAMSMLRRTVKKKARFDVYKVKPIDHVKNLKVPALFGAPKDDTFVSNQHTKDLYLAHKGQKKLSVFEGDHNSRRPIEWIVAVVDFMKAHLLDNSAEMQKLATQFGNQLGKGMKSGPDMGGFKGLEKLAAKEI